MWHSRPSRDPPPFMANTTLNFHFDYRHPSLSLLPVVYCHIFLASDLCRLDVAKRVGLIEHVFVNKQNNPDGPTSCKRTVLSNNSFVIFGFWAPVGLDLDHGD